MLWSTEMLLEPRTSVHIGAGGGHVPFIIIPENGPSGPFYRGGSRCFNSSSFCLRSSLGSFHIELFALLNHLPLGFTLSPGPLDLLCILLQEGRPFRVEQQPPVNSSSFFQGMASRGFLILDPLLWESPIKSREGPECDRARGGA